MQLLIKKVSTTDFLENELIADFKSEYHNGEVVKMTGATENHNLIVSNILGELYICLKGKNCKVYPSDLLLELKQCKKYVYPDVMLLCEKAILEKKTNKSLEFLTYPEVVIEVLSESTEFYDKTEKKRCYFMLESLKQYIMIDSRKIEVISYTITSEGDWLMEIFNTKEEKLTVGDCKIPLEDIYNQLFF